MITDTMLRLYLDGTLDAQTADQVRAALDSDSDLRQRVEQMRTGQPSITSQPAPAAAPNARADTPAGHMGATEEQMQPNVETLAQNPAGQPGAGNDAGIDPRDELTPG